MSVDNLRGEIIESQNHMVIINSAINESEFKKGEPIYK